MRQVFFFLRPVFQSFGIAEVDSSFFLTLCGNVHKMLRSISDQSKRQDEASLSWHEEGLGYMLLCQLYFNVLWL